MFTKSKEQLPLVINNYSSGRGEVELLPPQEITPSSEDGKTLVKAIAIISSLLIPCVGFLVWQISQAEIAEREKVIAEQQEQLSQFQKLDEHLESICSEYVKTKK
jgi:uncharacterized protein HemX